MYKSVSKQERIVLEAHLNGHMGEGNIADEEIMGKCGAGTRNREGSMVVDFAKRMDLVIVNIYFKKKDEHMVTYKSDGKVDDVMCRRRNLKEMCDCEVIVNECIAKQQRMVVCKMAHLVKKKIPEKIKPKNTMVETEGKKELYRLPRQRDRAEKDLQHVRVIKDENGNVMVNSEAVLKRWKEYFEKLMNEENDRDPRKEEAEVVNEEVNCISREEVKTY